MKAIFLLFTICFLFNLSAFAKQKIQLAEGYYGNTINGPYPGNDSVGPDPAFDNENWYVAPPRYCGYKLTWTSLSKDSFLLERGMNPKNGAYCDYQSIHFKCESKVCTSLDYEKVLVPLKDSFQLKTREGLISWIYTSTVDPQTYLFPVSKTVLFREQKFSTMEELCEYAKDQATKESLQACRNAGYSNCRVLTSTLQKWLAITKDAECNYEVVTQGK